MGELIVNFITSLDGYASAKGWPGWHRDEPDTSIPVRDDGRPMQLA